MRKGALPEFVAGHYRARPADTEMPCEVCAARGAARSAGWGDDLD